MEADSSELQTAGPLPLGRRRSALVSIRKDSDELIPTGTFTNSYRIPLIPYIPLAGADRVSMVELTTSSIHALETPHTASSPHYSRLRHPPSAVRTSWYPALRARLPSEAAQRPESIPLAQSCRCSRTRLRAPSSASQSSRGTHGGRPSLWAA